MKKLENMRKQKFVNLKGIISLILSVSTAVAPMTTYALDIQIQRAINLRTDGGNVLQKVGRLEAGSVVSIPDEYAVRTNGAVNFELTLNNWLSRASELRDGSGLRHFTERKRDYYFPIRVVRAAPGSQLGNQETYMIALHYLHRKGSLLVTTEAADLQQVSQPPAPPEAPPAPQVVAVPQPAAPAPAPAPVETSASAPAETEPPRANLEAAAPAPVCTNCTVHPLAVVLRDRLDAHLRRPLRQISARTEPHINTVIRNFERSCRMQFESFVPQLRQEIANSTLGRFAPNALSSTLMLSLMTQETTGNCNARGDHGRSVGLFQVQNARYSRSALSNPVTNARAAMDNLEGKHQALANDFDFDRMSEEDRMRVLISAYNGGERWVRQAKSDLQEFNRRQGANLDHNNWEHLRIFYFRRHLDGREQREFFGNVSSEQRKVSNTLINLSYTENLLPRRGQETRSLQEAWNQRLSG